MKVVRRTKREEGGVGEPAKWSSEGSRYQHLADLRRPPPERGVLAAIWSTTGKYRCRLIDLVARRCRARPERSQLNKQRPFVATRDPALPAVFKSWGSKNGSRGSGKRSSSREAGTCSGRTKQSRTGKRSQKKDESRLRRIGVYSSSATRKQSMVLLFATVTSAGRSG